MRQRWSRLGLRGRLMTVGLLGVATSLLIGGLLLYAVLNATVQRSLEQAARDRADSVAALVARDRVPEPVPVTGSEIVQILDGSNRVVGGSLTADRLTPLVTETQRAQALSGRTITVPGSRAAVGGQLVVAAAAATAGGAAYVVVAGVPTADQVATRRVMGRLLLIFFPAFLAVLGLIAWRVIGSSLRPVDALRAAAEEIEERSLGTERLPVPATGDEIAALATTLNGMLDRLAAARSRQRAFVADAAHELRSPLTSLRAQLDVAAHLGDGGALPDELRPDVDRMERLIEDLLLLARSTDDPAAGRREPVELAQLLTRTVTRYAAARVPVVMAPPGGAACIVAGRPGELERAIGNLVDNAVRHARSRVELSLQSVRSTVVLTVTDDGHGIEPADRERVFDRFTRLDEARDRDSGGAGLGLSITQELLRRNDSSIRLEDAAPGLRAVVVLRSGAPGAADA